MKTVFNDTGEFGDYLYTGQNVRIHEKQCFILGIHRGLLSDEGTRVFGKWACGVIEQEAERLVMNVLIEEEYILPEGGDR